MQYTTHFNLMLPEGTDIVNPLVQQNPNFSDIDAAMYANKQGAVGSATELTAGTVHTITRANPDSNVIKFTATSNWTAGDSMVIDSTPVSVFLSDGTAPATGAYVINTEVLLILSGTRVTLITSKSDPSTIAADHVTYDNSISGLSATDAQSAIDEVNTYLKAALPSDIKVISSSVPANGSRDFEFAANSRSLFIIGSSQPANNAMIMVSSSGGGNVAFAHDIYLGTGITHSYSGNTLTINSTNTCDVMIIEYSGHVITPV